MRRAFDLLVEFRSLAAALLWGITLTAACGCSGQRPAPPVVEGRGILVVQYDATRDRGRERLVKGYYCHVDSRREKTWFRVIVPTRGSSVIVNHGLPAGTYYLYFESVYGRRSTYGDGWKDVSTARGGVRFAVEPDCTTHINALVVDKPFPIGDAIRFGASRTPNAASTNPTERKTVTGATTQPPDNSGDDANAELRRLQNMLDQGLITQEEFDKKKKEILKGK
jgi:hypothetical protein